jgi:hypothetical protein
MKKQILQNKMYPNSPDLVKHLEIPHQLFAKIIEVFDETYLTVFFDVFMLESDTASNAHKRAMNIVAEKKKQGDPINSPDILLLDSDIKTFSMALTIDGKAYTFMRAKEYGYYFSYPSNSELAAKFEAILKQ